MRRYQQSRKPEALRALVRTIIERRLREAEEVLAELKALKLDDEEARKAEQAKVEAMKPRERRRLQMEREKLVAKSRPNLYTLLDLEAYADYADRKYEEALSRLEKLDGDYGARLNALSLRGEILQRLRRWDEAERAFHDALEIDPETPGALAGLARNALANKRFEASADYARRSVGLLFFQPKVHYLHGLALYRMGAADDAECAFLICVSQAPLFAAAYRMLGEIYRHFKPDAATQAHFYAEAKAARQRRRELHLERTTGTTPAPAVPASSPEPPPARLEARPDALAGIPEDRIVTVVSGLPRSGTSLMMQILEAAGFRIFTDEVREADESNQRGYYEHQKVASLRQSGDLSWLAEARGAAVKVVAPLLSALPPRLSRNGSGDDGRMYYRVIYMEREIEEILHSQTAFLERLGKGTGKNDGSGGDLAKAYLQQVRSAKQWCRRKGVDALSVDYRELVERPEETIATLAAFLRAEARSSEMVACVDPQLYRSRKEG